MNQLILTAPQYIPAYAPKPKLFLAGSIEMGAAKDWQLEFTKLAQEQLTRFTILNPRRSDWDSSWEQSIDHLKFREQVDWELSAIEIADWTILHFEPDTKSPITLLELGYLASHDPGRVFVHCPDGFWRKGNVDIVCYRYQITQVDDLSEVFELI